MGGLAAAGAPLATPPDRGSVGGGCVVGCGRVAPPPAARRAARRALPARGPPPPPLAISLPHFRAVAEKDRSDILQALLCREDNGALVDLRKTSERAGTVAAVGPAEAGDATEVAAAVDGAAAAVPTPAPAPAVAVGPGAAASAAIDADAVGGRGWGVAGGVSPDAALANVPLEGA